MVLGGVGIAGAASQASPAEDGVDGGAVRRVDTVQSQGARDDGLDVAGFRGSATSAGEGLEFAEQGALALEANRGTKRRAILMDKSEENGLGDGSGEDQDEREEDVVDGEVAMGDVVCGSKSVSEQVFQMTLDSPRALGRKRSRVTAPRSDRTLGTDNCDSVPSMVDELTKLLDYVAARPTLQTGSASFMRDYLRTMLVRKASSARESVTRQDYASQYLGIPNHYFDLLPDEVTKHVLTFLDGMSLARAREVSHKWNELASDVNHWKRLCLERWRSLETDNALWKLLDKDISLDDPIRWRKMFPVIARRPQWRCRLQKTGRFICHLIAHQVSGTPLESGLPRALVVERRFNWSHLESFVLPDASLLYFEPETEKDKAGFEDFIEYLVNRTRAGLAMENDRRYIFIPPCEFSQSLQYEGTSLLGIAQSSIPQAV